MDLLDNAKSEPLIFTYKLVDGLSLYIDVYPPSLPGRTVNHNETTEVPVVVYFHGGGLTVGNRKSWFPRWLYSRLCSAGVAFICADYRLLVPCTGYDVVEDIKDLFTFLADGLNPVLDEALSSRRLPSFSINPNAIGVSGTSSGGLCAYLAVMHASPKPIALLSMYGMGGNFLTDHYLQPKLKPFFRGREILDPSKFQEYLYPNSKDMPPIADSPLAYHPQDSPTPGFPANPRMFVTRLYLQQGTFLDYYTGDHNPQLSELLRQASASDSPSQNEVILQNHTSLFPQFGVTPCWPQTLLVHGTADTAVHIQESRHLHDLLNAAGVDVTLTAIEGKEHSFDYESDAEDLYGGKDGLFDMVAAFLMSRLRKSYYT